jgi:hypothetical protein
MSSSDNSFVICSVQESVQQASEYDSLDAGPDDMDEQARSSQHLSTSTAEISLPPSEDSDRMSGQVENDDGLGLVQSDTPIGAADGDNTQITSTLTAFSVMRNICVVGLSVGIFVDVTHHMAEGFFIRHFLC